MITSLHLTISDKCGANCIFCPKHQTNKQLQNMSVETAKRIIDDVSINDYGIKEIQVGNNGDCFFNPELITILRYIKSKQLSAKIIMFTNFQLFNERLQKIIVSEHLVDAISMNIDSMSPDYYRFIKSLDFDNMIKNVKSFMDIRDEFNNMIPLTIYVINIDNYIKQLKMFFNATPEKIKNVLLIEQIKNDYDFTNQQLLKIKRSCDEVKNIPPIFWAERNALGSININYDGCPCPHLEEIHNSMFISPDGTAYMCCLDNEYKLSYGNIYDNTIKELLECEKRNTLLYKLATKDYLSIGLPCTAIPACYTYTGLKPENDNKILEEQK